MYKFLTGKFTPLFPEYRKVQSHFERKAFLYSPLVLNPLVSVPVSEFVNAALLQQPESFA